MLGRNFIYVHVHTFEAQIIFFIHIQGFKQYCKISRFDSYHRQKCSVCICINRRIFMRWACFSVSDQQLFLEVNSEREKDTACLKMCYSIHMELAIFSDGSSG